MVTFTLPEQLRRFACQQQASFYDALFAAVSSTLNAFARDAKHLGGTAPPPRPDWSACVTSSAPAPHHAPPQQRHSPSSAPAVASRCSASVESKRYPFGATCSIATHRLAAPHPRLHEPTSTPATQTAKPTHNAGQEVHARHAENNPVSPRFAGPIRHSDG